MQLCFHPSKDKSCHNTLFPPTKLGKSVAVKVILTGLFTTSSMHNFTQDLQRKKCILQSRKFSISGKFINRNKPLSVSSINLLCAVYRRYVKKSEETIYLFIIITCISCNYVSAHMGPKNIGDYNNGFFINC